jgi:hypothetical protein
VVIFGLVWFLSTKKKTKSKFFLKKPKPVQTDLFRFGFLEQKPVWLGFFDLAQFFSGFFSVRVRFGLVFSVSDL